MRLYQTYWSPFPTRVRLVLYAKGLPFDVVEPPGFAAGDTSKAEYRRINPIGRIPALELDDGRVLPESEVICEYLEDAFPTPSLRPADPFDMAQVRLISRICDFYVVMAMVPLFAVSDQSRRHWDQPKIDDAFRRMREALSLLEVHIGTHGYAVGHTLTQADGALLPLLFLAFDWAPSLFGRANQIGDYPRLAAYWKAIPSDPHANRVLNETIDAIAALRRQRAAGRG